MYIVIISVGILPSKSNLMSFSFEIPENDTAFLGTVSFLADVFSTFQFCVVKKSFYAEVLCVLFIPKNIVPSSRTISTAVCVFIQSDGATLCHRMISLSKEINVLLFSKDFIGALRCG